MLEQASFLFMQMFVKYHQYCEIVNFFLTSLKSVLINEIFFHFHISFITLVTK
jgi:hypothetical protein